MTANDYHCCEHGWDEPPSPPFSGFCHNLDDGEACTHNFQCNTGKCTRFKDGGYRCGEIDDGEACTYDVQCKAGICTMREGGTYHCGKIETGEQCPSKNDGDCEAGRCTQREDGQHICGTIKRGDKCPGARDADCDDPEKKTGGCGQITDGDYHCCEHGWEYGGYLTGFCHEFDDGEACKHDFQCKAGICTMREGGTYHCGHIPKGDKCPSGNDGDCDDSSFCWHGDPHTCNEKRPNTGLPNCVRDAQCKSNYCHCGFLNIDCAFQQGTCEHT